MRPQPESITSVPVPRLLVATTNPHKVREIRPLLEDVAELVTLAELPALPAPAEDGPTFESNARIKARHYARATELLTVAEDSGLEIEALGGAPGLHSARFQGADTSYPEKFRAIYRALAERGYATSRARFVCALALASPEGRILFESLGVVEGELAPEPRGGMGFGYDPIVFYPPLGRTLAELTPEEKSAVSHRGRAFRALREHLERRGGLASG